MRNTGREDIKEGRSGNEMILLYFFLFVSVVEKWENGVLWYFSLFCMNLLTHNFVVYMSLMQKLIHVNIYNLPLKTLS